jgi:ABC-type branched-subunit amino acid transport system ATPase component/ABC-type branched-subunit amino acid transport system permease subunit
VVALVLGVLTAMGFGLLFAVPALRTRGVELAVVTLALGAAVDAMLFNNSSVTGSANGTDIGSPSLFGLDLDATEHPVRYALLVLALFAVSAVAVANLRRGRSGRRLLAVRTNERAAAAMGISVFSAKLHAFAVGGALAGLGGVLIAFRASTVVYAGFSPLDSMVAVAEAVIGGIGFIAGSLVGAMLAPGSIGAQVLSFDPEKVGQYLPLISGVLLLVNLVSAPNGVVHMVTSDARRLARAMLKRAPAPSAGLAVADGGQVRVPARHLRVEDLRVRYGGVVAVDGVSLEIEPGTIVGLIGPNGAGKTSVIDAVSGFAPSSGRVMVDDQDISGWSAPRRARCGLARSFQALELFEDMTVAENLQTASEPRDALAMATDLVRPGNRTLPPMAVAAIRAFQLDHLLTRRPPELSFGQRRLVAIARAVAMEPSILLLDEPAAGLDELESREFATLVRRLADEWGIGVLVVEHDMQFVMGICDRVLVIDFGRPIASGTPSEVRGDRAAIAAYLGEERTRSPSEPAEVQS